MKYFVESYGCTMNYGEGDHLSKKMRSLGHSPVDTADEAEIVILNTCTVIETTEKRMLKRMNELRSQGKEVIVTGCMAKVQENRISIRLPDSMIIPPDEYDLFTGKVESKYGCGTCTETFNYGNTAIIPIAQGCLGRCSYCITRFARGKLISRTEDDILNEFKELLDSGVKEFLLTAVDTACYGKDLGTNLPSLLFKILEFEGDYRLRIGMMNPNHLDPILDDMIRIYNDDRVYKFIHIPVQSGSNSVLNDMRRPYTVERFMGIVNRLRESVPGISIATDMISGFPGESDKDHQKSLTLIRNLRADTVNITRYSPRPGTDALELPNQVHGNVSKDRSAELTEAKNRTEFDVNSELIGKTFRVLVTEMGKNGTVIARTDNYRPVGIKGDFSIGDFLEVEITECASTYLIGTLK